MTEIGFYYNLVWSLIFKAMTKIYTKKKEGGIDAVTGTAVFPIAKSKLWSLADHPNKFAPHCINLDDYSTDAALKAGNKIEEVHSFLGWKQKYVGAVKSLIEGKEWSMHTYPVGFSPFPLPHYVKYSFSEISPSESQMSIACEYKAGGLLSLPIARTIVRKIMERAIKKLLMVPEISN